MLAMVLAIATGNPEAAGAICPLGASVEPDPDSRVYEIVGAYDARHRANIARD